MSKYKGRKGGRSGERVSRKIGGWRPDCTGHCSHGKKVFGYLFNECMNEQVN